MVSNSANRVAFIISLIKFMDTYGFHRTNINWEVRWARRYYLFVANKLLQYPTKLKRSGCPKDTNNLIHLIREIRAAFGYSYRISIALAPNY
jgi:chitinase